jgi:hypothetical protein
MLHFIFVNSTSEDGNNNNNDAADEEEEGWKLLLKKTDDFQRTSHEMLHQQNPVFESSLILQRASKTKSFAYGTLCDIENVSNSIVLFVPIS